MRDILVFHCYVIGYCKLRDLKQHTFIISWFLWVRNLGTAQSDPLVQGFSPSFNQVVGQGWGLI